MQYPVSAQYAPLSGLVGFVFGHVVNKPQKPKKVIIRRVFEVSTKDQILSAIRQLSGPTCAEIMSLCDKTLSDRTVRGEISRMCRTNIIRADGDKKPHRYYENKPCP